MVIAQYIDDDGWKLMKTQNSVSQKIRMLSKTKEKTMITVIKEMLY